MNPRKALVVGIPLALLSLLALWTGLGSPTPAQDSSSSPAPFRLHVPTGQRWTYRLDYEAQTQVQLAGPQKDQALAGGLHLVGDLVLRGQGTRGGSWLVGLRLENLQRHSLRVFGQEVLPDTAAVEAVFGGREAVLELSEEGLVQAVSFREEDPSLFKNTVQTLVGELQVVVKDGAAWTVEEGTSRGRALTEYERLGEDASGVRLLKRRTRYTELRGLGQDGRVRLASRFEVSLAHEGLWERLVGQETVERLGVNGEPTASTQVRVSLVRGSHGHVEREDSARTAANQRLAPGVLVVDPKVRAQMLTQQVDGMTAERLFALLELHANGGVLPDHNHFLLQATGLLEQHPELCAKMVELFQRPSLDTRGRALVLDLLAGTGTPEAQAALVQALSTKEARGDARYHMLLSRLSLVSEPTVDTVRFAERTYGATQGDLHVSSAYALGATAGALYRQEQSLEALAAVRRLASDLGEARTPSEQSHLLLGLGNAGIAEQTPLIARHAGSSSAEVRRAAAKALRKIQTPEAASTLMSLVADAEAPVQAAAMDSLGRRPLDSDTLVRLRDVALAGGMKTENYHPLVSLVAPYLQTEPTVRDLLEFLLTQDVPDRQIRSRIRGLLET
ncbi:hypothetical protein D187_009440 [Cystobacter fuscus DSM 2262]|uniref:Vitellogenin domain-containing protein n=1 Tax=Cystobacter fuscus (strain ATCC 25194 / DSM 2262 / NBRC 100088 / M29) TaxID=1242864 RepID=S9QFU6_CYSF2|nr:HEAT repeat domain-containing protein [Cystobacter fuscus]EPX55233.1 hypothetical protein D187_009440 [Cystobacter fuscus DSM 2262]